jgi:hypothetical protein
VRRDLHIGTNSTDDRLIRCSAKEFGMVFQRRKPAAIGVNAPYPGFVEPALATSVDKVPSGDQWLHQIKFDAYRVQVQLRDAAVKLFTRRGNGWTKRFRKIAADACHMNAGPAIIGRSGGAVSRRHNGFFDPAKRTQGPLQKDRDGRVLGADTEAVVWLRRCLKANRNYPMAHFQLAAALALLGSLQEARAAVRAGLAFDPAFTIRRMRGLARSDDPTFRAGGERIRKVCAWPGCQKDDLQLII